ncbi:hypothetical protein [Flavobacterium sp.]|uniref:hypothetical protein n=1 Tax=Flavobacterium sp. TaxID=239 RepID=UPI002614A70D|nr:hypothetical protein [Flavobacterium sp.]
MNLFENIISEDKLNPVFKMLQTAKQLDPAKLLIHEISSEMKDNDRNFIEQFQSTGFNSRLWEIFLFKFFKENGFSFDFTKNRPDFHLEKNGIDFFVEASLSNEVAEEKFTKEFIREAEKNNDLVVQEELIEHYVMRMGSVLYSKLQKKYWELEWVKGKPLVIAIAPAHNYLSNFLPDAKIIEYLYGLSYESKSKEEAHIPIKVVRTENHKLGEKEIPPNFFELPDTENISAIIFTNNSDLHKFNRMGHQKGISKEFILMERAGLAFGTIPSAYPVEFSQSIIPGEIKEDWNEAVCIFHNPNAIIPLNRDLISNIRQTWIDENGELEGTMPKFYPFNSKTLPVAIE